MSSAATPRTRVYRRADLQRVLNPRSIAIVGASTFLLGAPDLPSGSDIGTLVGGRRTAVESLAQDG